MKANHDTIKLNGPDCLPDGSKPRKVFVLGFCWNMAGTRCFAWMGGLNGYESAPWGNGEEEAVDNFVVRYCK